MCSSFSFSPSSIFETGMPVHLDTTSATSSSVTLLRSSLVGCCSALLACREPALQLGNLAVRELGHAREILRASRRFQLEARALQLFLDVRGALHRGLLGLPHLFEVGVFLFQRLELLVERAASASSTPRRIPSSAPRARSSAG